jgi:hypothetical protein
MSPYQSLDGITVGLAYCQVVYDIVDRKMSVQSNEQPFGRFAMDENTGEVFITAFREDNVLYVGWTRSVSTCERVRESFLFHAPPVDGEFPDFSRIILRNSWFERRNCRICGLVDSSGTLAKPCVGGPLRGRLRNAVDFAGFHYKSRRFRGDYFGTCVKTLLERGKVIRETVPIAIAIRKAPLFIDTVFKNHLWKLGVELPFQLRDAGSSVALLRNLGLDPRSSSKMMMVGRSDYGLAVAAALRDPFTTVAAAFGGVVFEMDQVAASIPSVDQSVHSTGQVQFKGRRRRTEPSIHLDGELVDPAVQRRRNADLVEPDPILAARKRRNRMAAGVANERRKRLLEHTKVELAENRRRIPIMQARQADLRAENLELRQRLDAREHLVTVGPDSLHPEEMDSEALDCTLYRNSGTSSAISLFPEFR